MLRRLGGIAMAAALVASQLLGALAPVAAYAAGLPWDCLHGAATVGFLAAIWVPWGARIRHAVAKYGL